MTEQQLAGKVAIVTGASKGIAAAIARTFAAAWARGGGNYATAGADAERGLPAIAKKGGTAIAVQADMSVPDDVRRLFARTREHFDTLDILVNSAGVYAFSPIEQLSADEFHRQ